MTMTDAAYKVWEAFKAELIVEPTDDMKEALAAAIRVIADELSYTIFMPNNDVTVVEKKALYELANELEAL